MCLIIQKASRVTFHETWLEDFWIRNHDGAGVMWTEKGKVVVEKILSPNLDEWLRFYRKFAARRACTIHLRMRTHGDINFDNVHPYEVGGGVFLMHNGILSSGNAKDRSRSDTWHFIEDVLRAGVTKNPDDIYKPAFASSIAQRIGSGNKFVLQGARRAPVIVNYKTGVRWGGAWFSNTYA